MSWLLGIPGRLYAYLGVAVAVILAVLKIRHDGVVEGREQAEKKINEHTGKVQDEWRKIDAGNMSPDDAADRLLRRNGKQGG
jgi:hypothetical protein